MTTQKTAPKKPTARERLEVSSLRLNQRELMGDDVDLDKFYLMFSGSEYDIRGAVLDISVTRTIEGASSVEVIVTDQDRLLLRSGKLAARQDIEIDGLFFRLAGVQKNGNELTLVFEDREVAVLRTYNKPIKAAKATSRTKVTRAEFALRLLREVKEFKIRYVIPELHIMQPIEKASDQPSQKERVANRSLGIPKENELLVKGTFMAEDQRMVANQVLDTGASRVVKRRILVMAIMAAIQESTLRNLQGGDLDSVGVFQQRRSQGWPASRDVATDAGAFYDRLITYDLAHPQANYWTAIADVQHPREDLREEYAKWRTEAEHIVTAYGVVDSDYEDVNSQWKATNTTGDYEFYRGKPPTSGGKKWEPEDSWECLQRLAEEVNWRCFFVSGTCYFIDEGDLFKSQPVATIDEDSDGIESINGDYDQGKPTGQVTISCRMARWAAPPGSVIQLVNMGPWNGRWLVNDVKRSLFDPTGTITLKKPRPRLPEPKESNIPSTGLTWDGSPMPDPSDDPRQFKTASSVVQPIPLGKSTPPGTGPVHGTLGLSTNGVEWPAIDFFAKPGTPVVAPEMGVVTKLSGKNPLLGAYEGAGGPLGYSIYIRGANTGTLYYLTHLDKVFVGERQHVSAGQEIATVADYDRFGRQSHVHAAVEPGHGITIEQLGNALQAVK